MGALGFRVLRFGGFRVCGFQDFRSVGFVGTLLQTILLSPRTEALTSCRCCGSIGAGNAFGGVYQARAPKASGFQYGFTGVGLKTFFNVHHL